MLEITQMERQMYYNRDSRSWIQLPKNPKITQSNICIKQIGPCISSFQNTKPFFLWIKNELKTYISKYI